MINIDSKTKNLPELSLMCSVLYIFMMKYAVKYTLKHSEAHNIVLTYVWPSSLSSFVMATPNAIMGSAVSSSTLGTIGARISGAAL